MLSIPGREDGSRTQCMSQHEDSHNDIGHEDGFMDIVPRFCNTGGCGVCERRLRGKKR